MKDFSQNVIEHISQSNSCEKKSELKIQFPKNTLWKLLENPSFVDCELYLEIRCPLRLEITSRDYRAAVDNPRLILGGIFGKALFFIMLYIYSIHLYFICEKKLVMKWLI